MKPLLTIIGIVPAVILSLHCFAPKLHAQKSAALREALATKLELQVVELSEQEAALIPEGLRKLPMFSADTVPRGATYYSLQLQPYPPLPVNALGLPCWSLGDGLFLLNDVTVDYVALREEGLAKQQAEKAERAKLKASAKGLAAFALDEEGSEGGGGMFLRVFAPDELGLDLETKTNATGYFSIHIPNTETNGSYDLYMTTNLSAFVPGLNLTNWLWLLRTTVGQTNLTVPNLTNDIAFFRLGKLLDSDGDGLTDAFENLVSHTLANNADQNTNGILDGWEWKYFGNLNQSATNDYDGDGVSNGLEYTNQTDPNTIVFSIAVTNEYVNALSVPVTLNVTKGVPASYAVVVDGTNFSGASWQQFTTNPTVALGMTQGWHDVWIGVRGLPIDAQQTWQWIHLKLDSTAPKIAVTNLASGSTTAKPMIQLYGYASEPLTRLTYDVVNGAGSRTNQPGFTVNQFYDRNAQDLTTNWFECLDVAIANGTNLITFRATDRAGNATVTNLTYIFNTNGDTTAPTIALTWPQPQMKLSGTAFALRGSVDDETAAVTVQIVSTNGITNRFTGLVERDGKFWAENLPLSASTNFVTVTATDATGNTRTTNFAVIKSSLTLTMTPLAEADLNRLVANVSGSVSEASYAVWVNGIAVTNINGNGDWSAANVPITPGGTASYVVTAYPPGEAPSGASPAFINPQTPNSVQTGWNQDKPPQVYVQHYNLADYHSQVDPYSWLRFVPVTEDLRMEWTKAGGGNLQYDYVTGIGFMTNTLPGSWAVAWPVDSWTPALEGIISGNGYSYNGTNSTGAPVVPMEQCDIKGVGYFYYIFNGWQIGTAKYQRTARTIVRLFTGGKNVPGQFDLHALNVSLYEQAFNWAFGGGSSTPGANIAPGATAGVFGLVGNDNMAVQILAGGRDVVVTPVKSGPSHQGGALPLASKLNLKLKSVTFTGASGYYDVITEGVSSDFQTGIPYPKPHWTNDQSGLAIQSSPALYVSGSRVKTTTEFRVNLYGTIPVIVKGEASGGLTTFVLWGTNTPSGATWSVDTVADNVLTTNLVDFINPLTIKWSFAFYRTNQPLNFVYAGTSKNQLYVSLKTPTLDPAFLMHTIAHLACANSVGMSSPSNIVQGVWQSFPGLHISRQNGDTLRYWFAAEPQGTGDSFSLILYADGTCGAWANLFLDAQKVHGITGSTNWWIYPPLGYSQIGIYTNLQAQGNSNPPTKFIDHNAVEWNGEFYDPSYGKKFSSKTAWENAAVSAYYTSNGNLTNDVKGVLECIWEPH